MSKHLVNTQFSSVECQIVSRRDMKVTSYVREVDKNVSLQIPVISTEITMHTFQWLLFVVDMDL